MQAGAKVGLQSWVRKTHSLFLYYHLLIIVLFSIWTTVNLLLPHPVYVFSSFEYFTRSKSLCYRKNVYRYSPFQFVLKGEIYLKIKTKINRTDDIL